MSMPVRCKGSSINITFQLVALDWILASLCVLKVQGARPDDNFGEIGLQRRADRFKEGRNIGGSLLHLGSASENQTTPNGSCADLTKFDYYMQQLPWKELVKLGPSYVDAYTSLGYTEQSWDDFARQPDELKSWSQLAQKQQHALQTIGYSEEMWECDVEWEAGYPDPPDKALPPVSSAALSGKQGIILAKKAGLDDEGSTVRVGHFQFVSSQLLASVVGRILVGFYGLDVRYVVVHSSADVHRMLEHRHIDIILDVKHEDPREVHNSTRNEKEEAAESGKYPSAAMSSSLVAGLNQSSDNSSEQAAEALEFKEAFGFLGSDGQDEVAVANLGVSSEGSRLELYATRPMNKSLPYFRDMENILDYWSVLSDERVMRWLPKGKCTMGPWANTTAPSTRGVWCVEESSVPLIWARDEFSHDVMQFLSFIKAKELKVGIEFLESADFFRRVRTVGEIGAPAFMILNNPSVPLTSVKTQLLHINLPLESKCGDPAGDFGKWICAPSPVVSSKLAGPTIQNNALLKEAFDQVIFDDDSILQLYDGYLEHFRATKDQSKSIHAAADQWVQTHEKTWRLWFRFLAPVSMDGRALILGFLACGVLAWLISETCYRKPPSTLPDSVDRKKPTNIGFETMAGTLSTLSIMMDAVGIAGIAMAAEQFGECKQAVMMHVLLGQFVGQSLTCLLSNMETPIVTPSIELMPFITILMRKIEEATVGRTVDYVLSTMFAVSMFISMSSGLLMYAIGKLQLGGMLRFLPFSVKTGVMAGMGIVLLSLGLELCCEESMLDLESVGEIKDFVEWDTSKLWLPGAVAALLLFLTSAYVVDSPYTILVFFVVSISGIHVIRVFVLQQSLEEMIEAGWLFEPVQSGTVLSVWAGLDVNKIVWSVLADNMSTIWVAILVAPILNNLGDLAVIKTVLPAKVMGEADFNQEMEAQGRSHILLGMCGGFSTDYGNDDTIVHRKFGGLRRVSVYVHCVTLGIALVCPYVSIIIPYIPKFANGAIIALAGFEFLNESLVETYWQLQKSEYVVVVIFALLVLLTGGAIEKAILVGTFLGFGVFVVKYADVDQVKFIVGRSASTVSLPDNFRLNFCGLLDSVVKAKLSGFLFFGSTPAVIDRILENIAEIDNVVLIIDWAEVPQVDTAAVVEFERLEEAVESRGGIIVFSSMNPRVELLFRNAGFLTPVPEKLCEVWPKEGEQCSVEECLDALRQTGLEQSSIQQVGSRLVASTSIGTLAALLRDLKLDLDGHQVVEKKEKSAANDDEDDAKDTASDDGSDSGEDGAIVVLESLDEAQFLIEKLRLTHTKIDSDSPDKVLLAQLSCRVTAFDRFRILAKAMSGSSTLCPMLREKVRDGSAKLQSFAAGEVILELSSCVSCVHILLFGSVTAFSEVRPLVFRHTDTLHIFGEESLTPSSCVTALGYQASSACVVLSIGASSLTDPQRNIILEVIKDQHLTFKSLRTLI